MTTEDPIPLSKRTRPATPRDPNYVWLEPTTPKPPRPGRGAAIFLFTIGAVLFFLGVVFLFTATNLFLGMFYASAMSIGGTAITGAVIITAVRYRP